MASGGGTASRGCQAHTTSFHGFRVSRRDMKCSGFLPLRACFSHTENFPNPLMTTSSPFCKDCLIIYALKLIQPTISAITRSFSSFFIKNLMITFRIDLQRLILVRNMIIKPLGGAVRNQQVVAPVKDQAWNSIVQNVLMKSFDPLNKGSIQKPQGNAL